MVNRRQFFQNFLKRGSSIKVSDPQRQERRQALERHVRLKLFPTDFALTTQERSQLGARVRSLLEQSSDEELFSEQMVQRLTQLVGGLVDAFRMASAEVTPHKVPNELRLAAVRSVTAFLAEIEEQQINAIATRLKVGDRVELEEYLKQDLATWFQAVPDAEVLKYDQVSIQDPARQRLRTICGQDPLP